MKSKDFRDLSSEELNDKEKTLKKELFDLQYQRKLGRVEKPSQFRVVRRNIARVQTILREREITDERSAQKK